MSESEKEALRKKYGLSKDMAKKIETVESMDSLSYSEITKDVILYRHALLHALRRKQGEHVVS